MVSTFTEAYKEAKDGKWTPIIGQRGSRFKVDSAVPYAAEGAGSIPW